jgi:hypothetical protein
LVTPPSNGFESDNADWTTMTGKVNSLVRKQMTPSTCQGAWYLTCDGVSRGGPWDGPKINLVPYVVPGHEYLVTLAARFAPENAPSAASSIVLSTVNACSDSSVSTKFRRLQADTTRTDWVRLTGTVMTTLTGCAQLSEVTIYVETDAANQTNSIDIDDFQVIDMTSATGSGGAGGVAGAAGNNAGAGATSSGTAGAAGRAAAPGAAGNSAAGSGGTAGAAGNGVAGSGDAGASGTAGSAGDSALAGSAGSDGTAGASF